MDTKQISISDFNYNLPDERIAKFPVTPRDHSKLLVYDKGQITDDHFYNLTQHVPAGSLMVFNNTKVIRARMLFHKSTGALIEVFLLEPYEPADYEQIFQTRERCSWLCLVGNLKKWKGEPLTRTLTINQEDITITATRKGELGTSQLIEFSWSTSHDSSEGNELTAFAEILDAAGQLPIPPYLNRETQPSDLTTYQTVYSKIKGSVAAPTAGLHFTPEVLASLDAHGVDREELTLHVGAGTFKPVKSAQMGGHEMHTEHIAVRRQTIKKLLAHQCRAVAVGTTSVRTLESLYYMGLQVMEGKAGDEGYLHVKQWEPYDKPQTRHPTRQQVYDAIGALDGWLEQNGMDTLHGSTQIIIAPGYEFKIVERLITNFHQPQSTLLLLVSAFTRGNWREIYVHALAHDYRFLSYGDSSILSV